MLSQMTLRWRYLVWAFKQIFSVHLHTVNQVLEIIKQLMWILFCCTQFFKTEYHFVIDFSNVECSVSRYRSPLIGCSWVRGKLIPAAHYEVYIMCSLVHQLSFFFQFIYSQSHSEHHYYYWKLITGVNLLYEALLHFKFQLALYLTVFELMTQCSLKEWLMVLVKY